MSSGDATYLPIKNTAYRAYFPILDADGDPVPGASGLDSEVSIDGASMADCTNEATYIADSAGSYYLDLVASEMNSSCSLAEIKSSAPGKTTVLTMYPVEEADYGTATQIKLASVLTTIGALENVSTSDIVTHTTSALVTIDVAQASSITAVDTKVTDVAQASAVTAVDTKVTDVAQASAITAINTIVTGVAQASSLTTVDTKVTDVAQASALTTVDGKVTDVAQASAVASIPTESMATVVDAVWDEELTGATHNVSASSGRRLRDVESVIHIEGGTLASATSSTFELPGTSNANDDFYNMNFIVITDNTGIGQVRHIDDYTGDTKVGNIKPSWITTPDSTSGYAIMPIGLVHVDTIVQSGLTSITNELDANSTQLASIIADTAAMEASYAQASALLTTAAVKTQVASALSSDTYAELGAGTATTTASISTKLSYLHQVLINKNTSTSVLASIYAADGSTTVMTSTVSSDGTTYTKGRFS